jgi:hypothetical protein
MSEAPERIWLTGFIKDEYGARLGRGTISDLDHGQNPDYPEYVRADRIEELEAENENLKANLTHLRQTCQRAWDKCDGERVKLAKAVEALQQLVIEYDEVALAYDEPESMTAAYVVACNTLAEMKGEK